MSRSFIPTLSLAREGVVAKVHADIYPRAQPQQNSKRAWHDLVVRKVYPEQSSELCATFVFVVITNSSLGLPWPWESLQDFYFYASPIIFRVIFLTVSFVWLFPHFSWE